MKFKKPLYVLVVFTLTLTYTAPAQNSESPVFYEIGDDFSLSISGSSNVRDWDADAERVRENIAFGPSLVEWLRGEAVNIDEMDPADFEQMKWLDTVRLSVRAESMDSGISALNSTMYEHLDTENHPTIIYSISEVMDMEPGEEPDQLILYVVGTTRAAGEDNSVEHQVLLTRAEGGSVMVSGDVEMKITDFNIEPPTFMRGALVTDDVFTVHFDFHFAPME